MLLRNTHYTFKSFKKKLNKTFYFISDHFILYPGYSPLYKHQMLKTFDTFIFFYKL